MHRRTLHRRTRIGLAAGAALTAAGLLAVALLAPVSVAGAAPASAKDAVGDTVTDAVEEPIKAPRADIIGVAAESGPEGIVLGVRVQQSGDPLKDANWSSTASLITWDLDVNGDSNRDYEIEYAVDPDAQQLAGSLYRLGNAPRLAKNCDPSARFTADGGHTVVVDPKCLGNPTAFSYRVRLVYDTDVTDDGADYATDVSPDQGWSSPVAVSLPPGVTPATAPPVSTPIAPLEAPPEPDDPETPTPQASPPPPTSAPALSNVPAPTSAKPILPQQAARRGSGSASPSPFSSGPAAPVVPASPASGLASTGLGDRTLRMAAFAAGIILIGMGLLFANRRPSLR